MLVAFWILFSIGAPITAKVVFTTLPMVIWILGGFAIHREYREHKEEQRKQDEVLDEAKRILDDFTANRRHPDSGRDRSHQEERHD